MNRLERIVLAYIASQIVAISVSALWLILMVDPHVADGFTEVRQVVMVVGYLVMTVSVIPATAFIALAEWRHWQSIWPYVGFAIALAFTTAWIIDRTFALPACGSGAVAGAAYWLIAGRFAGLPSAPPA